MSLIYCLEVSDPINLLPILINDDGNWKDINRNIGIFGKSKTKRVPLFPMNCIFEKKVIDPLWLLVLLTSIISYEEKSVINLLSQREFNEKLMSPS